ncbi:MAG: type II secretion system protein GspC [Polyangiaceae bacterium]
MGVDRFARKYFNLVVPALLAVAAYFQAVAVVELLASRALALTPEQIVGPDRQVGKAKPKSTVNRPHAVSGDPILARNAFDSVTGPLDKKPLELSNPEKPKTVDLSDPLHAPPCQGVVLNIVSESVDPAWSLANIRGPKDTAGVIRRVGDPVGELQVAYVGFNPVKATPAVWLIGEGQLCQSLLFTEEKDKHAAGAAPAPPPAPEPEAATASPAPEARSRRRSGAPAVPSEIADKIQKVSDTDFNIERSVVDRILENQAELMRSARIVPEQKDGKTVGIRLFGIRSDTLLGTLGMQNGDRLEKINGYDMASPEKALEAYARLRTASKLTVTLSRRGNPMTIEYQIK